MKDIQAIILAGGESKRMGSDKGMLKRDGKPFVQSIIEAVKPITARIMIISSNMDYKRFGYPVFEDIIKGKGPVGGIYTGLSHSRYEYNLVLSCDIPFAQGPLLSVLLSRSKTEDVLYYSNGENLHPLVGVYRKSLKDHFEKCIKADKLKLMDVLKDLNTRALEVPEPMIAQLRNVNTKEDYKKHVL